MATMSSPSRPPTGGINPTALRGAVDLGALAKAREAKAASAARAASGAPSYVIDVTTAEFQSKVLEQSLNVPVVLDLWADWCGPCKQLTPVLEQLADEYAGRFLLAKVDVDAEPQIAEAFQVQSIPSVFAVVKAQPIPLFQGAVPLAQARQFIDELLKVAADNGVAGTVGGAPEAPVDEPATAAEDDGDERLDAAADAIAEGDWDAAESVYAQILADNPADADAKAGTLLVRLQRRVDGLDFTAVVQASDEDPGNVDKAIPAADVDLANGDAERGYARLIQAVRLAGGDDRDRARAALIELFELAPPDDTGVQKARRDLAAALF